MSWTAQQLAWINLALVPGVGPKTMQKLLRDQRSPQTVYQWDYPTLRAAGLTESSAQHILKHPPHLPSKDVEAALSWAQAQDQHLLTFECPSYPQQLTQIATSPALLMVKGKVDILGLPQVAIVGSRYPTSSGAQQAYDFAQGLANAGLLVTSGLARGVDALAHQGALDVSAKTIAVLGTGINEIYPKSHAKLAQQISEHGAVISEFPLSTKAFKGNFPRRNRIVSGLSLGTLVIEATLKSGSLITARQALEQNREVMAIPGAIHNPQKAGCHYLIRQGAKLIETPEQVLEELSFQIAHEKGLNPLKLADPQKNDAQSSLQGEPLKVFNALDYDGLDMESLVLKTRLDVGQLSMVLMELELAGLLKQEQGLYAKC